MGNEKREANQGDSTAKPRGFAAMTPERRREIAGAAGRVAHAKGTAPKFTPEQARAAGRKGGETVSQNREHMVEIGRRGGETTSKDRGHMREIGRTGGEAVQASGRGHVFTSEEARAARRKVKKRNPVQAEPTQNDGGK